MKKEWTDEELREEEHRVKHERMGREEYKSWVAYTRDMLKWQHGEGEGKK